MPRAVDPRRSPGQGPVRVGLIIALLLLLGWLSLAVTVDQVLGRSVPGIAARWAPWAAGWRIQSATHKLIDGNPTPALRAQAAAESRAAINRAPLRAAAARLLGTTQLLEGSQAVGAYRYAHRLSRRDLPTQLYLIETKVAANDVAGALRHYDIAMRTNVTSRAMLGDILINASDTPEIAQALGRLLATRPAWLPEFYQRFAAQAKNPAAILIVAGALDFRGDRDEDAEFITMALERLVQLGAVGDAEHYYQRVTRTTDRIALIRNGGFERPNRFQPFDWIIASEPTHSGIVERRPNARGVALTLTGNESHAIARQLLVLHPGRYRITATVGNVPQAVEERPKLVLSCQSGAAIATLPFAAVGEKPRRLEAGFTVPQGCEAQWLDIVNTPAFDGEPADPWIDDIGIAAGAP
ncbi:hypothetical protein [Sphingomonas sp. Leaf25]|uniref:hypothetical protein n=1 Tax=Sphingomonas sp. Leaf25 TaxID=1735692 RepID=UPI0007006831|nr:hypothetical protein [Sphingomonas sp. Leaf25]KQN00006.1 hypothetical protein ASE78_17720 [Sphingomonas sp. Leaf25]